MTTGPLTLTLDASVIINAINPAEAGHAASRQMMATIRTHAIPVIAPTLVLVEVAATIGRILGDSARARAVARQVHRLPVLRLIPLSRTLALLAADLAAAYRLRGADAVYAAVAQRYGTTLISLDAEHLRRLAGIVPVRTPADALATVLTPSGSEAP